MTRTVKDRTDEELLILSRAGSEAFGVFYDRHHLAILAGVRHRVSNLEVALDLTGEIFAVALERCETFTPAGEGSAKAWLYAIARNKLIDLYRQGGAEDRARRALQMQPVVVSDEQLEALEQRLAAEATNALDLLADLPADERAAVTARVLEEGDYSDIARAFKVSESVVRKRVSRGLGRMRAGLDTKR